MKQHTHFPVQASVIFLWTSFLKLLILMQIGEWKEGEQSFFPFAEEKHYDYSR